MTSGKKCRAEPRKADIERVNFGIADAEERMSFRGSGGG
jgi:hypothetical protein